MPHAKKMSAVIYDGDKGNALLSAPVTGNSGLFTRTRHLSQMGFDFHGFGDNYTPERLSYCSYSILKLGGEINFTCCSQGHQRQCR